MSIPDIAIKAECPRGCGETFKASWDWDYSDDFGVSISSVKIEQTCSCDVDEDEHLCAAFDAHATTLQAQARRGIY